MGNSDNNKVVPMRAKEEQLSITGRYTLYSFLSGMRYPLPRWYSKVPLPLQAFWRGYFRFAEITLIFLFLSTGTLLVLEGKSYIGVRTECAGSIMFACYSIYKYWHLYHHRDTMDEVVNSLHEIANQLHDNPVANKNYLSLHNRHFRYLNQYCVGKFIMTAVPPIIVTAAHHIHGMLTTNVSHRLTPMLGWFPFDFSNLYLFTIACLMQGQEEPMESSLLVDFPSNVPRDKVSQGWYYPARFRCIWLGLVFSTLRRCQYTLLLARDVAVDITMITILAVVNNQLLFMGTLLGEVLDRGEHQSHNEKKKLMAWWVTQHQNILRIVDKFKTICTPLLFATYAYASAVFFLALLRLTEDKDFVPAQQAVVVGLNVENVIHLYVISALGDEISRNSMRISQGLDRGSLWARDRDQLRVACLISTRCSRPVQLKFADNRLLAVKSFSDIMKSLLSYFFTIYQLRN